MDIRAERKLRRMRVAGFLVAVAAATAALLFILDLI
jgi:hypothetical protein